VHENRHLRAHSTRAHSSSGFMASPTPTAALAAKFHLGPPPPKHTHTHTHTEPISWRTLCFAHSSCFALHLCIHTINSQCSHTSPLSPSLPPPSTHTHTHTHPSVESIVLENTALHCTSAMQSTHVPHKLHHPPPSPSSPSPPPTESIALENTEDNRRAYRELLVTTPGLGKYISGAIMFEETLFQSTSTGKKMTDCLKEQNIVPGIKVRLGEW